MEKKLKVALTEALDSLLHKTLEEYHDHALKSGFLKQVKSPKDFLLGLIVGDMMEGLGFCTFGAYKRYPKKGEFDELFHLINMRSDKIRDAIERILK